MTIQERIKERRIGIVGMARSGLGAAHLAKRFGGIPFVSDTAPAEKLAAQMAGLREAGIPFEVGGHTDLLLNSDYLVVSPGVTLKAEIITRALHKGLPVFSELEFASWVCRGAIVAITGTNGKTTTTTLAGELFRAGGFSTFVCGNIGLAFTEVADQVPPNGVAVVEVSSFQLETVADFRPHVAAILNITPDHLDRHGSMVEYRKTKFRIAENQSADDYFILNGEDPESVASRPETKATRMTFSTRENDNAATFVRDGRLWFRFGGREGAICTTSEIAIPGPHNLQNAAAALACTLPFEIPPRVIAGVLASFAGVEHRLERAGTVAGVTFINDSKATNVDSVCVALRSMTQPTYLILGGRDKGGSYMPIVEAGKKVIRGLIVIGEAREKIFNALGRTFPVVFAESLEEAVAKGFDQAHPGETVLLSPACASFDMFENFEHRGRVFKAAVASLKNGKKKGETVS
ncbi:MAG: UDP-N-acetylmuramoyl-L-alanine--D-glutamate ligase [Candidatus Zixiibacteriota bacterium]